MGSLVILLHFTFQALQAGKLGDNLVKIADEQAQAVVSKNHVDLIDRSLNEKGIWFSCYVQINFFNLTFPGKVCPSQGYENTLHVGVENLALILITLQEVQKKTNVVTTLITYDILNLQWDSKSLRTLSMITLDTLILASKKFHTIRFIRLIRYFYFSYLCFPQLYHI